eukprot:scaffold34022_cov64-Phaeocystis_antarctica.AAC.2
MLHAGEGACRRAGEGWACGRERISLRLLCGCAQSCEADAPRFTPPLVAPQRQRPGGAREQRRPQKEQPPRPPGVRGRGDEQQRQQRRRE